MKAPTFLFSPWPSSTRVAISSLRVDSFVSLGKTRRRQWVAPHHGCFEQRVARRSLREFSRFTRTVLPPPPPPPRHHWQLFNNPQCSSPPSKLVLNQRAFTNSKGHFWAFCNLKFTPRSIYRQTQSSGNCICLSLRLALPWNFELQKAQKCPSEFVMTSIRPRRAGWFTWQNVIEDKMFRTLLTLNTFELSLAMCSVCTCVVALCRCIPVL